MKILLIITGMGVGGAERQVCDLADAFAKKGHKVKIVGLDNTQQIKPFNEQITLEMLNMEKSPVGFFKAYWRLVSIIKEFQPDVVHSHMFHANIMARLLRLTISIPKLICTAHSNNEGGKLRMALYRYTNFLSDQNTNVSQSAVEAFIEKQAVKKGQMFAMPNGIDTDKFHKNLEARNKLRNELAINDDEYAFLAVGRLNEAKDYPNLLKAFQLVSQQKENAKLFIVGQGKLKDELETLSNTLGLTQKVNFLGLRKDISDLMNIADTYVLSSHYEGLAIVVGEAMSSEKVVIATNCGGPKEILGNSGYLIPKQNYHILAETMLKTMDLLNEEKEKLGKQAREYIVKNYSLDAVSDKWLEIYKGNHA